MKKPWAFLLLQLAVLAAGLVLAGILYPRVHPLGVISLPLDKSDIETRAAAFAARFGLESEAFYPDAVLARNSDLLRELQMRFGLRAGNRAAADSLPGHYWSVIWLEQDRYVNQFAGTRSTVAGGEEMRSAALRFDVAGRLLRFSRVIPDTVSLGTLTRRDAYRMALDFLTAHTPHAALAADSLRAPGPDGLEPPPRRSPMEGQGRLEHHFTWTSTAPLTDDPVTVKVSITGDRITLYEQVVEVPAPYRSSDSGIEQFLFIGLLITLLVASLILALRRWRAFEMDFRLGLAWGALATLFFLSYLYASLYRSTGPQVIFIVLFNSLFTGGSLVLILSVGESLSREMFRERFVPLDLLRNGHVTHSRIGAALVRGTALGALATVAWLLLIDGADRFLPMALLPPMNAGTLPFSSETPLLRLVAHIGFTHLWVIGAYVVFGIAALRRLVPWTVPVLLIWAVVMAAVHREGIEPVPTGVFIDAVQVFLLLLIYFRYDFLTGMAAYFTTGFLMNGLPLVLIDSPAYTGSALGLGAILAGVVGFGAVCLLTRDRVADYERLAPTYYRNITERERLQRELEIARSVQMGFLPRETPAFAALDIASRCRPALEVGGDYYDFIELGPHRLGVVIGDVSGKGTQAAFYMTLTKGFLRALAGISESPAFVLTQLNRLFYENVRRGVFISMIYAVFDMEKGQVTIARAGHNPVILRKTGTHTVETIHPRGLALGMEKRGRFEDIIQEVEVPLQVDDLLVFYTDGFTEAMNGHREEFGEDRFASAIERHGDGPAEAVMNGLFKEVRTFAGRAPQQDDMTIVVVKVRENGRAAGRYGLEFQRSLKSAGGSEESPS